MKVPKSSYRLRIANARPNLNAVVIFRFWFVALGILSFLGSAGARAQTADVYTVTGVSVDITAAAAAAARKQAIEEGHRLALNRLLQRLVLREHLNRIPTLTRAELDSLVLSFGIDSERRSSVRYIGDLRFQFGRAGVRAFLQKLNVGFAETRSKNILLLPVYSVAGASLLWDDPNPWLNAWNQISPSDGLVPIRLPAGDLTDIRDITAEQAASGNERQLTLIAERYGAHAALVAKASQDLDPATGTTMINVATRYFGGGGWESTVIQSFAFGEGETAETVLVRAAQEVSRQIEEDWKRENLLRFDRSSELIADLAIEDLREWVEIRQRLRQIAFLRNTQLVSVSRRQMSVRLSFFGDAQQLRVALDQRDLVLEQSEVNWTLRDRRTGPDVTPAEKER